MDFSETITLFKQGTLDIDCKSIILTQNKVGGVRVEGQGYIRQNGDGVLVFKVYVSKVENLNLEEFFNERFNGVPGTVRTNEAFYDFAAIARDGTPWAAQRIVPSFHLDISGGSTLIDGQISTMSARTPSNNPAPFLRLHFFEEYDVPLSDMSETELHGEKYMIRDKAEFQALGSKFKVRKRDGDTVFEIESENNFPDAFHLRVQESLQYLVAKPAFWRARIVIEGKDLCLELVSPWRKSIRTQFSPPIASASAAFHEHGWALFTYFLTYVIATAKDTHWNPVAYHLYNACEASANSVDAWAVGYSVAVEAISGLVAPEQDTAKSEHLAKFQKQLRQWLKEQTDFADLAPRMEGLIGTLGTERVQDKLYAISESGHIDKTYIKAWSKLRNRHVHPKLKDLKKPDAADAQQLFSLIHQVEVLLRQLTFYLIGYSGPFTDYGVVGFPLTQYPLPLPQPVQIG